MRKQPLSGLAGTALKQGVLLLAAFLALVPTLFIYFVTHYFFASMTAHIAAMYSAFALVCIAAGAPAMLTCVPWVAWSGQTTPVLAAHSRSSGFAERSSRT